MLKVAACDYMKLPKLSLKIGRAKKIVRYSDFILFTLKT